MASPAMLERLNSRWIVIHDLAWPRPFSKHLYPIAHTEE